MSESTDSPTDTPDNPAPDDPAGESDRGDGAAAEESALVHPARLRPAAPSQEDLDGLSVEKRLELLEIERQREDRDRDRQDAERERARQSRHQWINSGVLLIGVLLAGGSLLIGAITWRTGQDELRTSRDELRTAQEGQITDRYTKATEQLGSSKRDVRTAAIYALERIAKDSPRDQAAIRDVLASFIREHDPAPTVKELPSEPETDIQAALSVLIRRPTDPDEAPNLDLHGIRVKGASLFLHDSDQPYMTVRVRAKLSDADLSGADLTSGELMSADLDNATLTGSNMSHALLTGADLAYARLVNADLTGAWLHLANLEGANLTGATLTGADLKNAYLGGADLRGVKGLSERQIRAVARVNASTMFGPSPMP